MRAVGYVRVSTEEQAKYGISLEAQEEAIRQFCQQQGWEVTAIFRDEGVSGAIDPLERPGFRKLLEFCRSNNINICVVYSLDRFSRRGIFRTLELLGILNLKYNILIVPVVEFEVFKSPDNFKHYLYLTVQLAEIERELTRRRVRMVMQYLKSIGKIKSVVDRLPRFVKNFICNMYREGHSIRKIAQELGISTYAVYRVLTEYCGHKANIDTCPRCHHRMVLESAYPEIVYYCRNCGYVKKISRLGQKSERV